MHVHSFSPIANPDARVLVLGTMPGIVSLRAGQYYAHPRNSFWRIVGEILGFDAGMTYEARAAALVAEGIALWDVLHSCTRTSSLDSDIQRDTIVPNDFASFFESHRHIRKVCFNGATAENLYVTHVRPSLENPPPCEYVRLPSTSPAHASMAFAEKARLWRIIAGAP
jgi:double-stranded uracil-DNA glycosylase